jgi:hypothetical protein
MTAWLDGLADDEFGHVERYIDLLPTRAAPCSARRSPDNSTGSFYRGRQQTRITYSIATGRIIVLLTVFAKTRPRERTEVDRARRAMQHCIDEWHIAIEEGSP